MDARRPIAGVGTLEVVIALSLFSVVLIAIVGLLVGSISAGATAEAFSVATNLARQRLDQAADDISRFGAPGAYPAAVTVAGRQYTLTTLTQNLGGNLVDLEVRVTYQVAYASTCGPTASCPGNVRTYERVLRTRVRRP